jgi:anti-sigma regulatory factor (Ser/Thr protein kinase)
MQAIAVTEPTGVAEARRRVLRCAAAAGFSEADAGRTALIATEAANNLLAHAGGGQILLQAGEQEVTVLALDKGPGMNLEVTLEDGFSTRGGPGTGLGAISRLATRFDAWSTPGKGTVLLARVLPAGRREAVRPFEIGGISVAHPNEQVGGDAWDVRMQNHRAGILVADGLGHGPKAAEASAEVIRFFRESPMLEPVEFLKMAHPAMRTTRGAAVAMAVIDRDHGLVHYAGSGNISGMISSRGAARQLVSTPGTLGHEMHHVQQFQYGWDSGSFMVMHSDGVSGSWSFASYPGLENHDPTLVAAVVYRDHNRGRDDATVVFARAARPE